MALDIIVYSGAERLGLVEGVTSLQWLEEYYSEGEFRLVCMPTDENRLMLMDGNVIYIGGNTAGVITAVELDDTKKKQVLNVRGTMTIGLLNSRVAIGTTNIYNIEDGFRAIVAANTRECGILAGTDAGLTFMRNTSITGGQILERLSKVAQEVGMGLTADFNTATGTSTFRCYSGVDRTQGEAGYNGYFSDADGNLGRIYVFSDKRAYYNIAYVAGAGEGAARKCVWAGSVPTGEKRRELYVDARDLSDTYSTATDTGETDLNGNPIIEYITHTYTDEEYTKILRQRGNEKLRNFAPLIEIIAEVTSTPQFEYGTDYNLGDIVPIVIEKYGLTYNMRITAVKRAWEVAKDGVITLTLTKE